MSIRAFTAIVWVGVIGACDYVPGTKEHQIAEAKVTVQKELRDPQSAVFEDVVTFEAASCGWVKAKNGFGGYTNPMRFVVDPGSPYLGSVENPAGWSDPEDIRPKAFISCIEGSENKIAIAREFRERGERISSRFREAIEALRAANQ